MHTADHPLDIVRPAARALRRRVDYDSSDESMSARSEGPYSTGNYSTCCSEMDNSDSDSFGYYPGFHAKDYPILGG